MGKLQELLSQNGSLKAVALALALLLWTAARIESPAERTLRDVPVTIVLTDRDWTVRNRPAPVTVHFAGPTRDLLRLSGAQASVIIPIDDVSGADTTVVIERDWIRTGARSAGSISDVTPAAVRLSFDPVQTRDAGVRVLAIGAPPEGFALAGPPITVPGSVRLRGSAEALGSIRDVLLEPVALGDLRETTTVTRSVDLSLLGGLAVQPDSVSVIVTVEAREERTFSGVSILFEDARDEARPIDTLSVVVSGARSVVGRLRAEDLRVLASWTEGPDQPPAWTLRVEGVPDWVRAKTSVTRLSPPPPSPVPPSQPSSSSP